MCEYVCVHVFVCICACLCVHACSMYACLCACMKFYMLWHEMFVSVSTEISGEAFIISGIKAPEWEVLESERFVVHVCEWEGMSLLITEPREGAQSTITVEVGGEAFLTLGIRLSTRQG